MWFEYVPSKENIADGPSRGDDDLLRGLEFEFIEATLPPAEILFSVVGAWEAAQALRQAPKIRRRTSRPRKRSVLTRHRVPLAQ